MMPLGIARPHGCRFGGAAECVERGSDNEGGRFRPGMVDTKRLLLRRESRCGQGERLGCEPFRQARPGEICSCTRCIRMLGAEHLLANCKRPPKQRPGTREVIELGRYPETAPVCRDCMVGDAGIELATPPV